MNEKDRYEFGTGHDFESGAYPTSLPVTPRGLDSDLSTSITDAVEDRDLEYVDVSGLILDTIPWHPPFIYKKSGEEPPSNLTTVFLGSANLWYRVNFWGDVGKEVHKMLLEDDSVSLNVQGLHRYDEEIKDIHVFDGDDQANWETSSEPVQYKPKAGSSDMNPSEIEPGNAVPLFISDVISATGEVTRTDASENKFKTNHLTLRSNDQNTLAGLYNHHAERKINLFDTVGIFAGWGPSEQLAFVPKQSPSVEYECEISAYSFSGFCNFSQHDYIDIE